ncbi:hypothetical protein BACCELL_01140 [Bacteroides cellulosilyticus DSM 14838]|uniref:Uncharacterized protein n=1 Tax=Bacteroides cellulosilyticus DSM 14838 TaxID=537012 RepID=E2NA41_9BACE|nr:hypothetical protein BACCELL_01140 [Bacteroides cellulosilyticus DSM 14838]
MLSNQESVFILIFAVDSFCGSAAIFLSIQNGKEYPFRMEYLYLHLNFFNLPEGLLLSFNQHDKFIIGDKTVRVLPVYDYFKNIH